MRSTHDKLRRIQTMLGHRVKLGDLGALLDLCCDAMLEKIERTKFASTSRPQASRAHVSANPRYIPRHVKRAVWSRDGGRCTFVSESGHRCEARAGLEWDHVRPVARGGRASVDGIRLLCRSHNQLEAERVLGTEFMERKRREAGGSGAATQREGA